MKNSILVGVLFIAAVMWLNDEGLNEAGYQSAPSGAEFTSFSDDSSSSFDRSDSNRQVQGEGVVVRTLPDDNDGSRHQRFILELPSGQTILIAHNIDLAPRIPSIAAGDIVEFYGEYEWNEQGGVVHWTHHDPGGRHQDGWLKAAGRIYQ